MMQLSSCYTESYQKIDCIVLTDVTQTGYIWQKRTQESREITVPISAELNQILDRKGESIAAFKKAQDARTKLAEELSKLLNAQKKAQRNQQFLEAMRKAMTGAGAGDSDVQAILNDPYFNSLMHFDNLDAMQQNKLVHEHPETVDLAEVIDDARYDVHDLTRWVDDPVRRYIDDYVIPMMTIASCFIPGTQAVTVPRAISVAVPRVVPLLGRIATAYGAEEIYRRVTTFFNEQFKGKGKSESERKGSSGYKTGQTWNSLISVDIPAMQQKIGKTNKQAFGGGQMRTDGKYVYRFDPAHKTGKIHMERYRRIKNNRWRGHGEVDPTTGELIEGSIQKTSKRIIEW